MKQKFRFTDLGCRERKLNIASSAVAEQGHIVTQLNPTWFIEHVGVDQQIAYFQKLRPSEANEVSGEIVSTFDLFINQNKDNPFRCTRFTEAVASLIPSISNGNIVYMLDELKGSAIPNEYKAPVIKACKETMELDRVLTNIGNLNNRFNFTRFIVERKNRDLSSVVEGMCELLDTYSAPIKKKYIVAVETFPILIESTGREADEKVIVQGILEYFLGNNAIINDHNLSVIKRVSDDYGLNEYTDVYLADKQPIFRTILEGIADEVISDEKENDEQKSQKIVKKQMFKVSEEQDAINTLDSSVFHKEKDQFTSTIPAMETIHRRINAICSIPLALDVKRSCVYSQALNCMTTMHSLSYEAEDFIKHQLNKQLCGKYEDMALCQVESYLDEFIYSSKSMRMMMEDGSATYDIDDFIKKYKAEQKKDKTTFARFMNSIYAKPAKSIVEKTPHILSMVRTVFIFSPIAIPMIGPILSMLNTIIDKLLEQHITAEECKKLINSLRTEKANVKSKLNSLDATEKAKAEKYISSIDKYTNELVKYREDLGKEDDEPEDDTDTDDDFGGDFDFDDDYDFDSEIQWEWTSILDGKFQAVTLTQDDLNYSLESALDLSLYARSIAFLLENDLEGIIRRNASFLLSGKNYYITNEMVKYCPLSMSYDKYADVVNELFNGDTSMLRSTVTENVKYRSEHGVKELNTPCRMYDIIREAEVISAIQEGIKMSDLKLTWATVKNRMRKLSAKEKSACQQLDAAGNNLIRGIERATMEGRREAIIRGQICPSLSKVLKLSMGIGALSLFSPVAGLITAVGMFASSKVLNAKEKVFILDEIDTELKVVEQEIERAKNDDDMNRYRFMLNYEKKLARERKRIKYGLRGKESILPSSMGSAND